MNQITPQIWIGSSSDARNAEALKAADITHILNVAEDLQAELGWRDGFTHFHCGLRDADNDKGLYEAALKILAHITASLKKVLVHCHEGSSRSVYIVACHMVREMGLLDVKAALELIQSKGRDINVKKGHMDSFKP